MNLALKKVLGIGGLKQGANVNLKPPTLLTSSFTVDTILGQLNWTNNAGGDAQFEVYSATNGAGETLLATTIAGATSYQDLTCKQNASVVYRIRVKKGTKFSDYVAATALITPLCWKTNQAVLTAVIINQLTITAGKTVTVNWGDGTSQTYTGDNTTITKNYAATGQYNVWISGDVDYIVNLSHYTQSKTYGVVSNWVLPSTLTGLLIPSTGLTGVITNWVLPSTLTKFQAYSTGLTGVVTNWVLPSTLKEFFIQSTGLTGVVTNWVLPSTLTGFYIYSTGLTGVVTNWVLPSTLIDFRINSTGLTGSLPQITGHASNSLNYQAQNSGISDTNVTVFRKAMTVFNISNQTVAFPTANIDKVLKAAADWYQANAPTANCTFTMSGANMGIPTSGSSNADLVRLVGYYTAAGRTATVVVRTS